MKRIYAGLFVALAAISCFSSSTFPMAAVAATLTDAIYTWEKDSTISASTNYDSINSTSDSLIVVQNWVPEPGYEYMLMHGTITGTNAANAEYRVQGYAYDLNGTYMYRELIDSVVAATAQAIALPIGKTLIGSKFKIVFRAGAANGAVTVVNRLWIYKRKPILRNEINKR